MNESNGPKPVGSRPQKAHHGVTIKNRPVNVISMCATMHKHNSASHMEFARTPSFRIFHAKTANQSFFLSSIATTELACTKGDDFLL